MKVLPAPPNTAIAAAELPALWLAYWLGQEQLKQRLEGPLAVADDWDERLTPVVARAVPAQLQQLADPAGELLGFSNEAMRAVVELLLQPSSDPHLHTIRQHASQGRLLLGLLAAPGVKALSGRLQLPEQLSAIPAFGGERLAALLLASQLQAALPQLELVPLFGRKLWRFVELGWALAEAIASRRQLQPARLRLLLLLVVFGWALPAAALKRQFDQLRLYHQDKARLAGNRALLKRLEQLRPPAAATLALLQGSQSGQRQLRLWGLNPGWYHSCLREWRSELPVQLRSPYARALEVLLRLAGGNQLLESPLAVELAVTASLQPLVSASELPELLAVRPKGLQP